jgi:hypothetical protein
MTSRDRVKNEFLSMKLNDVVRVNLTIISQALAASSYHPALN